jgi:signal transduction histidine kinase
MKGGLARQFLVNYLIAFLLSILAAFFAVLLLSLASEVLSKTLMKSQFPASALMRDDYAEIDATRVVDNGGGVTVVSDRYEVVRSEGIDPFKGKALTGASFTDFLTSSHAVGSPYHYDVVYNEKRGFWLIVTFPTSIRLDLAVAFNREAASRDIGNVSVALVSVGIIFLVLLAAFAAAFSRITSRRILTPLQKLMEGTKRLREGDYSARVDLKLKNEFAELQTTFNDMAARIESETALREQSEAERKRLILDVSHDLKNPLASVVGYSELCLKRAEDLGEPIRGYLQVIHKNSRRASALLNELFELARLEAPSFRLRLEHLDVCEYLRRVCGDILPSLEQAGFGYEFDIPDEPIYAFIDRERLNRVFHNLSDNAVRYNPAGTKLTVRLTKMAECVRISFRDDGVGIPDAVARDIFKPFIRADEARGSETGGAGLGLSIAQRIAKAHGGDLTLDQSAHPGCAFLLELPLVSGG